MKIMFIWTHYETTMEQYWGQRDGRSCLGKVRSRKSDTILDWQYSDVDWANGNWPERSTWPSKLCQRCSYRSRQIILLFSVDVCFDNSYLSVQMMSLCSGYYSSSLSVFCCEKTGYKPFHSSSFRYRLTYIDRYVINSGCVRRTGYFYPNQSRRLKM